MKAVIYLDSYFFMNMVLNGMLLFLLRRIRKLRGNFGRMLLAAVFGAFLACLMLICPPDGILARWVLTYPVAGGGMILLAFGYHGRTVFLRNLGGLIVITIGLGGIVQFLTGQYMDMVFSDKEEKAFGIEAGMVVVTAFLGSVLAVIFYRRFLAGIKKTACSCRTVIFLESRKVAVTGYLDSGNLLKEPVSGKPVAVLEKDVFLQLFEGEEREAMEKCLSGGREYWEWAGRYLGRMRLIPYKSIGKTRGFLNGFVADRMEIMTGEEIAVSMRPVIAVYPGTLSSDGGYRMILPAA